MPNPHPEPISAALQEMEGELDALNVQFAQLNQVLLAMSTNLKVIADFCIHLGKAADLRIVLGSEASPPTKGSVEMANKKASGPAVKCPCLGPKGHSKAAVMPAITITDPAPKTIQLQFVDATGAVVTLSASDSVTGTLTSDNPGITVGPGADSLNYVGTIPANTPIGTVVNLSAASSGTIQGSPANFTASVAVTLNIAPVPVAVDLNIVIG